MSRARLTWVTPPRMAVEEMMRIGSKVGRSGVDEVQIRSRALSDEQIRAVCRALATNVPDMSVVVNDRSAIAQEMGISLHLPSSAPMPAQANVRIGRSVHTAREAADASDAQYLIAGHVFWTQSHPDQEPLGLDGLRSIVEATTLPVIAIGGIDAGNARAVIEVGAKGVAVMTAIAEADDPVRAALDIRRALDIKEHQE